MKWALNPITRKRLARFRSLRRAWWSLWIMMGLYGLSLMANLLSNNQPLLVRYEGQFLFPVFRFYPESTFAISDRDTRPNYKRLREHPIFAESDENFMVFPPIPFSPHEIIPPSAIDIPDQVILAIERLPRVGSIDFNADYRILRSTHAAGFFGETAEHALRQINLAEALPLPDTFRDAVAARFENQPMPALSLPLDNPAAPGEITLNLSEFESGARPPRFLRVTLRERISEADSQTMRIIVDRDLQALKGDVVSDLFSDEQREQIRERVLERFERSANDHLFDTEAGQFRVRYEKEVVTYPFRPTRAHPFGLDSSGRDVLAQIIYALRIAMSFGLALVITTMTLGIIIGAVQGYFGGWLDITSQRLIEIWSALPFLYIIILLGSIYGRSFMLLLICYGIFNWIGISYYMRAEFLKLRKMPFVEAARVTGLKHPTIIFRHIMPNALVPVITFFPFSLVGAIGSLAALDYLGFGLPATSPSWGALLAQAQEFRFAWWLVLYPSLALFIVILLGVFVGEGVRAAFDPRAESKLE